MIDNVKESFLALIRLGIGHSVSTLPEIVDWESIFALASTQGMLAIVLDGAQVLMDKGAMTEGRIMGTTLKKKWVATVIQNYEHKYYDYRTVIGDLARFYNEHGFRLMVLKGYGLSLNYPKPEHRPCGDIDIWSFGNCNEADEVLSRELSIPIDSSHHHHTVFSYKGYSVENHFDFVNVHGHPSSARIERLFKELGKNDSISTMVNEQKIFLPCPNLNALFLLRHNMSHFTSTSMSIRQILDWGFFIKKYSHEIDWDWFLEVLDKFHMKDFFSILNTICIEDLGFDIVIFPVLPIDSAFKKRVLDDTLSPEFNEPSPSSFIHRVIFKYRRWKANGWKHKLCYKESMISSFMSGVWGHFLKPSSI